MKRFGRCCSLRASRDPRRSAGEVAPVNRLLSSSARACTGNTSSYALHLGSSPPQPPARTTPTISRRSPPTTTAHVRSFATASPKSPSPSSISLRRLSAPFLLLCHPDKTSSSSPDLRDTNLRATQTLNGLIDTVEALCDRCGGGGQGGATQAAGRIELQPRYEVEFLVPCSSDDDVGGKKRKKRGGGTEGQPSYTRRSIIITYPASLRDDVQIADGLGRYSLAAASALRRRTATEIVRLLKVAGASVPEDVLGSLMNGDSSDFGGDGMVGSTSYGHEDYLVDELDLRGLGVDTFLKRGRFSGGSDAAAGATRPRTQYEKSRQEFVKSVDWAELRRRSEQALRDAEGDVVTSRIMKRDERRKEQMVSNILARVTVDPNPVLVCGSIDNADDNATQSKTIEDKRTDEEKGLDPLQQLIALRRLSLLLADNYEELQIDEMGKLWDNTHIVLTPSRDSGDGSPTRDEGGNTIVQSSAAYGIPRRRNPLISGKESGFKFTYGSDGGITIYVPVDFADEELTLQLTSNVWDVYNLCGDGVEDLYPDW
eukprot:CAMPEP_0181049788 /NCGR_PEP_ID=MMETSP1070-20121207/16173_1 /TAXON_ID=265543 /ORGANISM="Minutocellus polymorphus, Strain NH13" /LENGTH=541 /DNA_ID=CAMNT_0023128697 /DNA_START=1 /DNA_END=1623 /DNA_ORIENTATION=-